MLGFFRVSGGELIEFLHMWNILFTWCVQMMHGCVFIDGT